VYLGRKVNAIGRGTEADTERRVGIACDLCEEYRCTPETSAIYDENQGLWMFNWYWALSCAIRMHGPSRQRQRFICHIGIP